MTDQDLLKAGFSIPCMEGAVDNRIGIVLCASDHVFNPFPVIAFGALLFHTASGLLLKVGTK